MAGVPHVYFPDFYDAATAERDEQNQGDGAYSGMVVRFSGAQQEGSVQVIARTASALSLANPPSCRLRTPLVHTFRQDAVPQWWVPVRRVAAWNLYRPPSLCEKP
jgi:hypothetical protein